MRTILTVAVGYAALTMSFSASAQSGKSEICSQLEESAHLVMRAKQRGVSMSEIMSMVDSSGPGPLTNLLQQMVIDAYSRPDYFSDQFKQRQVKQFETEYAAACYKVVYPKD